MEVNAYSGKVEDEIKAEKEIKVEGINQDQIIDKLENKLSGLMKRMKSR